MNGAVTFAQFGGLAALANEEAIFGPVLERFSLRREVMVEELAAVPGLALSVPGGAFYVFPEASGLMARLGAASSDELAARLLKEAGVMVIPGAALGSEGFIRVSFAVPREKIREAAKRIRSLLKD
jgi:aspartate aminotransferase